MTARRSSHGNYPVIRPLQGIFFLSSHLPSKGTAISSSQQQTAAANPNTTETEARAFRWGRGGQIRGSRSRR